MDKRFNPEKWDIPKIIKRKEAEEESTSILIDGLLKDPIEPEAIVELRALLSLTQKDLANWCGVSVRAVKAWEHSGMSSDARPCEKTARKCIVLLAHDPSLLAI